jgi:CheY-like chemotaxis protein
MNSSALPRVLLIEDDEDDLFLTRRVLVKAGIKEVFHVNDGRSAVDYLEGRGTFADRSIHPLPDIVLIDLKIPELTGHQVLEWIQTQPGLKSVRAYVLSSSGEQRDITRATAAGAVGYFIKPLTERDVERLM